MMEKWNREMKKCWKKEWKATEKWEGPSNKNYVTIEKVISPVKQKELGLQCKQLIQFWMLMFWQYWNAVTECSYMCMVLVGSFILMATHKRQKMLLCGKRRECLFTLNKRNNSTSRIHKVLQPIFDWIDFLNMFSFSRSFASMCYDSCNLHVKIWKRGH